MFVTNAPLYSSRPVTGWLETGDVVPIDETHFALRYPKGTSTVLSVRANDTLTGVTDAPGLGPNETFVRDGNTLSCHIGEGPRVLGVTDGV